MKSAPIQLAVRETKAAQMLDLNGSEFRRLVAMSILPKPVKLTDGVERWRVSDLEAILSGKAARPKQDESFEL